MKHLFLLLICILTIAASCTWDRPKNTAPNISQDTLHYQYKTFEQRAPDCRNKPDSACSVVKIKYPVFTGQPALNDTVRHRAATLFGVYKKADTSFKVFADRFMKAYEQEMVNRNAKIVYTLQTTVAVTRQDSSLLGLQISGYSFQGGAHGSSLTNFLNWNTAINKPINLGDILVDNYHHRLDSVAEKIFRTNENLSATESLKTNYFFPKDKFGLNDNFLITPLGLRFVYNEYEIKPYAAGKTEIFIPYTQIQDLLRPHTVVSQYHK